MATVYGSSGGRQRRPAAAADDELQHAQLMQQHQLQLLHHPASHYMEDPDLDVSSIVTEFAPLDDPFVPYFNVTGGEEMDSDLCAPLEASFASSIGEERMYARFRPQPAGYPPNTSTPRFSDERVEVPRGVSTSPQRLDDALAELMEGSPGGGVSCGPGSNGNHSPLQLVEASPGARMFREPPPQLSMLDQFLNSISRLVADADYARTTNCFRSKIPREVSEESLISFLTHCVRYPMRRPANTLLQARASPLVLELLLKTAMEPQSEPYNGFASGRDSYFRITLKNTVHSLGQLHQIIRGVTLSQRGFVDVTYSPVRGRVAFIGFNGNLPIRMSQPIGAFLEAEADARQHLNALFSIEITLSRCGDDAREVYITYFDNIETHPRTGQQQRVTEVNVYHIIHPAPCPPAPPSTPVLPLMAATHSPTMTSPPPASTPQRGTGGEYGKGRVTFPAGTPKHHEVHVETSMMSLAHLMEPTYTLAECFQLARSYPQHKW